ncbi:hypothetical protein [Caenimonas aquaedulcis]|uniref:Uncharacterized protein n=1 Tax=Caenimonas aquaedulcis TaxID=2793270 RepID=A0A931H812_9BURK|nr:hypothetical protein [Caenimonas aquaedulcis]MBG9390404.1 hypothetical protein [Caenimonas aquaedulcis]
MRPKFFAKFTTYITKKNTSSYRSCPHQYRCSSDARQSKGASRDPACGHRADGSGLKSDVEPQRLSGSLHDILLGHLPTFEEGSARLDQGKVGPKILERLRRYLCESIKRRQVTVLNLLSNDCQAACLKPRVESQTPKIALDSRPGIGRRRQWFSFQMCVYGLIYPRKLLKGRGELIRVCGR